MNLVQTPSCTSCVENRNLRIERWQVSGAARFDGLPEYPGLNELVLVIDGALSVTDPGSDEPKRLIAGDFVAAGTQRSFKITGCDAADGATWLRCVFHGELGAELYPMTPRDSTALSVDNVFAERPRIVTIGQTRTVRFDVVTSLGHASPGGVECESSSHEWLRVLKGTTVFTMEGQEHVLAAEDEIYLPPHVPNGVKSTSEDAPTVWLAVFFRGAVGAFDTAPRMVKTPVNANLSARGTRPPTAAAQRLAASARIKE